MNKKRFLAALAVATLAFSMVGCGSSGGGDSKRIRQWRSK